MKPADVVVRFERAVRMATEAAGLQGRRMVLAVSGGPDSLAMIHSLYRIRENCDLALHVGHLDHRLRGQASVEDAAFVEAECEKLAIACTVKVVDVRGFQLEHRLSLEDAAREVRYAFLARLAKRVNAKAVATGHTSDDHAETVLMHVVRGSGLQGLRGIRQVSRRRIGGTDVTLFRPILSLSGSDTLEYCRSLDLTPRDDESNRDIQLTRNRVRLELLPLLEEINPAVKDALVRLSRNATDAMKVVDMAVDVAWSRVATEADDLVSIDRTAFTDLDPAMQTAVARRALSVVRGGDVGIERVHVEDIAKLMAKSGRVLHLPGGLRLEVGYDSAVLSSLRSQLAVPLPPVHETRLRVPGITMTGGWRITVKLVDGGVDVSKPPSAEYAPDGLVVRLSTDALQEGTVVRARRPGDRFQPLGMSGTKKLKDFMVDEKISRGWRDGVPLVVTPMGIAWVVGWRIADWARVNGGGAQSVEVGFERVD